MRSPSLRCLLPPAASGDREPASTSGRTADGPVLQETSQAPALQLPEWLKHVTRGVAVVGIALVLVSQCSKAKEARCSWITS